MNPRHNIGCCSVSPFWVFPVPLSFGTVYLGNGGKHWLIVEGIRAMAGLGSHLGCRYTRALSMGFVLYIFWSQGVKMYVVLP